MVNHIPDPFPSVHPPSRCFVLLRSPLITARPQLRLSAAGCSCHAALSRGRPTQRSRPGRVCSGWRLSDEDLAQTSLS
ncbi:hypothetical protein NP493_16g05058 [Ridgeia piscesae]|uniref:Uncharacterized protein n=1 Tax=Ridgeia piscesae TaxID=27915 RepID=A0AAD9PET1_RIDPI|nr:hypothetical protein NP493_16g05058 [Ridgeia piscesae]